MGTERVRVEGEEGRAVRNGMVRGSEGGGEKDGSEEMV